MRRHLKWIPVGLVGLLLAFLAATKLVHLTWNHERSARSISRWASKSMSGRGGATQEGFTFGRVDYPWMGAVRSLLGGPPVRFDARDVHIWDPEGKEVLYANHVQAGLRLNRLVFAKLWGALPFTKPDLELQFVDAVVDEVRCRIALDGDGRVNMVAAFAPNKISQPDGGGMVISVERSVVLNGQYEMRFPGWAAGIERFKMHDESLRYSSFPSEKRADSPAFTYRVTRVEAPRGNLTIGAQSFPLEHVMVSDFHAEEPRRQDMVLKGSAQSRGSTTEVSGRLVDLYRPGRESNLFIELAHGAGSLASLPSKAMLSGDVSVKAHIHGAFGATIIDGEARGAELRVVGLNVEHIGAHYRMQHDAIQLDQITSDVAGGHARGEAHFDWKARAWRADLQLEGIQMLKLRGLAPLEVLSYLLSIPSLVAHANGATDAVEHLHIKGVELELHRRPRDFFPYRLTLKGAT